MAYVSGRTYLAIPGPSVAPDRVLSAMHRAAPNIYEGEIVEITHGIIADLRRVALTTQHVAIYIANGHGAWEAANANMFSRGDRALVAATGRFGHGWAEHATRMGIDVQMIDFGKSSVADPTRIAEALAADTDHTIRAVLVTHVDTASTARNDLPAIRAAIDSVGHPALLAVDAVASLACDELRMDEWGIDVIVGASQKGLMLPPGLGFLWFSDRALEVSRTADLVSPYWDWKPRGTGTEFWQFFGGTAPTHHLYGLRESLTMLLDEEGLPNVWRRHETLASAVWAAFVAWGAAGGISLNMSDPNARGRSVTAARIANGGAGALRKWLETEAGVTLGIGLGMALPAEPAYADFLRVAHMGHVNAHMTLGVLATMEAGMQALGIPHGPGALEAAAAAIARGSAPKP
ncbi:MAG: serine--glyoxylate transaminase [Devosia sp.]|uniref:pyridoxal-phosphate-dependent aminotransferase family protein n=1 Tax=Devosia sp. TaxID=1871048 RepID=UPI002632CAD6|nr:aminotransferase class V-fold PLP-dependent enzyme [Devosia sp.]MDB5587602.1 serine--glyoxylate transaminase [Devosia sp.]